MVKSTRQSAKKDSKKKAKQEGDDVVIAIPSRMPKRVLDKAFVLTDAYLATTFYDFLHVEGNQLGIFFPPGTDFKYSEKRWIPLVNPVIFYLITEIKPEPHSKHVPVRTTIDRWNAYTYQLGGVHPHMEDIIAVLHKNAYICHPQGPELDQAVETGFYNYVHQNAELAKRTLKGAKGDKAIGLVARSFFQVHSEEHLYSSWCFTEKFDDVLRKYRGDQE